MDDVTKGCRYPHLAKGPGGSCMYEKSCGCDHKKAEGSFSPPGEGSRGDQGSVSKSAALDLFMGRTDVVSKARPPAGFSPIPGGKKGGYRKRTAGGYTYWYPEGRGGQRGEPRGKRVTEPAKQHSEEIPEYNLSIVAGEDGKLSAEDLQRAKDIRDKIKQGIDKSADICQLSPPVCAGNMGIPRSQMPQLTETPIKQMRQAMGDDEFHELLPKVQAAGNLKAAIPDGATRDRFEERMKAEAAIAVGADPNTDKSIMDQFIDRLKAKGVTVEGGKQIEVGKLKATQAEIQAGKTYGMADSYLKGTFPKIKNEIMISQDGYILDGHHRYSALLTADPSAKMNVKVVGMNMKDFLEESFKQPGVFRADLQGMIVDPSTPHDLSGRSTQKSLMAWARANPVAAREALRKAHERGIFDNGTRSPLEILKARGPAPAAFRVGGIVYHDPVEATLGGAYQGGGQEFIDGLGEALKR